MTNLNLEFYTDHVNDIKKYLATLSVQDMSKLDEIMTTENIKHTQNVKKLEQKIAFFENERAKYANEDSDIFDQISEKIKNLKEEYDESQNIRNITYLQDCCVLISFVEKLQAAGNESDLKMVKDKLSVYKVNTWEKVKIAQQRFGYYDYPDLSNIPLKAGVQKPNGVNEKF